MHVLAVEHLSFSYDRTVPLIRDVSFGVLPGEFLSLVGPNGSGKTTLLRLLDRLLTPAAGRVTFRGADIAAYRRAELARRIAFVPQEAGTQFPFTVFDVVLMGRSPHLRGAFFESEHDHAVARHALHLTDVAHLADAPIGSISGGERQRVLIARALAQEPDVILLDEPSAHLDIAHQVDVVRLLRSLNRERGLTVVSVSHDLNLAASSSDRIAVLLCGALTAIGTPDEVLTEQRIVEVFRTPVLVDAHPAGGYPRITLLPGREGAAA
jgi:iron complex transport system ATP-binding protein